MQEFLRFCVNSQILAVVNLLLIIVFRHKNSPDIRFIRASWFESHKRYCANCLYVSYYSRIIWFKIFCESCFSNLSTLLLFIFVIRCYAHFFLRDNILAEPIFPNLISMFHRPDSTSFLIFLHKKSPDSQCIRAS